ncbi:hypothetical protein, partial [Mycobacterium tuberculosis]|uniref:hypothetical protein n=1 Tax=Mycobacterium tuberculosis TaxID=1773 RepID=UPI001BFE2918
RISATIRTARSRSSGGYLLDEPPDMTPSFPRTGVSGHAGAVQVVVPVRVAPDGLTVVSTSGVFPVVETRKF